MARRGENIYKRKDGRWEGRFKCGFHYSGRAKYRSVYGKTYQEVKDKLSKLKAEPEHYVPSGKLTVKALYEEWIAAVQFRVKSSTLANYQMKWRKHICPAFGGMLFEQLSAKSLHDFIEDKLHSKLSPKYVADIVIVFKTMVKYAEREHGFRNPLVNVSLPKSEKQELTLFSAQQQKTLEHGLLDQVDRTKLGMLLSYYAGLRIGEVCALKWSDVDLTAHTMTIHRTVQRIHDSDGIHTTRLMIGTPKSRSSVRTIPLPEFLVKLLRRFSVSEDVFILTGTEKPLEPRTMQYRFRSFLKKADLPSINYHSLRHMFATNSIRLGFDVKTLSEILGHSSVEVTLNRYIHSSMERKRACMNLICVGE